MSPDAAETAPPAASVIVRTRDSEGTLEKCLESVRAQTLAAEIVVVDSGSTDATVAIAERHGDRLIRIPAGAFTFGRALNIGAEAAAAPIHVALSSHSFLPRADWLELALAHYADERVAAVTGTAFRPDGLPLVETRFLDLEQALAEPYWGYSNTAGSWRATVWREQRFNEEMEACEDKEWAWRVLSGGSTIAIDPRLAIAGVHRTKAGARALFERTRREARALAAHDGHLPPFTLRDVGERWWRLPEHQFYPAIFYRANYFRLAQLLGRYVGEREGRRRRGAR